MRPGTAFVEGKTDSNGTDYGIGLRPRVQGDTLPEPVVVVIRCEHGALCSANLDREDCAKILKAVS